jgi:hypothetical protein
MGENYRSNPLLNLLSIKVRFDPALYIRSGLILNCSAALSFCPANSLEHAVKGVGLGTALGQVTGTDGGITFAVFELEQSDC